MDDINVLCSCFDSENVLKEVAQHITRTQATLAKVAINSNSNSNNNILNNGKRCNTVNNTEKETNTFHFIRWLMLAGVLPLPCSKASFEETNNSNLNRSSNWCSISASESTLEEAWRHAIVKCKTVWQTAQCELHKDKVNNFSRNNAALTIECERNSCDEEREVNPNNIKKCENVLGPTTTTTTLVTSRRKNKFDHSDSSESEIDEFDNHTNDNVALPSKVKSEYEHLKEATEQYYEQSSEISSNFFKCTGSNNNNNNINSCSGNSSSPCSSSVSNVKHKKTLCNTENPLQPATNSIYAHEYEVMHVRHEIEKDVERLHWDQCVLFAPQDVEETKQKQQRKSYEELIELLLTYCVHYRRPYRQGMHELMAFIMFAAWSDHELITKVTCQHETCETHLCHSHWLFAFIKHATAYHSDCDNNTNYNSNVKCEADISKNDEETSRLALIYVLFIHIINSASEVQEHVNIEREVLIYKQPHEQNVEMCEEVWLGLEDWYYAEDENGQSGVVQSCELVQNVLLKHVDASFSFQLTHEHEVHSVVYLVRWLRLLFLREFTLYQALSIWDVIFARAALNMYVIDNNSNSNNNNININQQIAMRPSMSFVIWYATAMLLTLREQLMHMEECQVLQTLMRYPRVTSVHYVIDLALHLEEWWNANKETARMLPFDLNRWESCLASNKKSLFVYPVTPVELKTTVIKGNLEAQDANEEENWQEFEEMSLMQSHHSEGQLPHTHFIAQKDNNNSSSNNSKYSSSNYNHLWQSENVVPQLSDVLRRQGQRATQILKNMQQLFNSEND